MLLLMVSSSLFKRSMRALKALLHSDAVNEQSFRLTPLAISHHLHSVLARLLSIARRP